MKFHSSSSPQRARIRAAAAEGARVGGEVAGQVEGGRGQDAGSGRRQEAGKGKMYDRYGPLPATVAVLGNRKLGAKESAIPKCFQ